MPGDKSSPLTWLQAKADGIYPMGQASVALHSRCHVHLTAGLNNSVSTDGVLTSLC